MNEQYCALPITSGSPAAVDAIWAFTDELVSRGSNCRMIFDALAADADCALAQAYAAALFLTAMTREGQVLAAPRIRAARVFAPYVSARERQTIEAVTAWAAGEEGGAVTLFRGIVESWPHDLVAAKLCRFCSMPRAGRRKQKRQSLAAIEKQRVDLPDLRLHPQRQGHRCSPL